MTENSVSLSPSQQSAYQSLVDAWPNHQILSLWTRTGFGRTSILETLREEFGAKRLSLRDFARRQLDKHPLSLEDTFGDLIEEHLVPSQTLIVDDLHLLLNVGGCYAYPRSNYFDVIGQAIADRVEDTGGRVVLGTRGKLPAPLRRIAFSSGVGELSSEDYAHVCESFGIRDSVDVDEVFRFAPRLNFYQLRDACDHCRRHGASDTATFVEYLRSRELASNVELNEVDAVSFDDLVGIDEVIESLESNVVFPLEDDAMACQYGLQPKRGVLLLGHPGTGKTTIGKALAHRLRGKFFLIDGTVISGTREFYHHISHIFEQAKENSPAVIFVDDSDVIFESGREHGLYRYLLTMLDGLESQSVGRVCVMMTAMDIRHIPPALIRSGRVELWLETRLPDKAARRHLIENLVSGLDLDAVRFDIDEIAIVSDGCTPADLKRLVNEAKIQYAWAQKVSKKSPSLTACATQAVQDLKSLKAKYEQTRRDVKRSDTGRPVWFDVESP